MDDIDKSADSENEYLLYLSVMPHNAENGTILDQMAPPSTTGVFDSSQADEAGKVVPLNGDGIDYMPVAHETPASEPPTIESEGAFTSEEATNLSKMKSGSLEGEETVSGLPDENLKEKDNDVEDSTTVASTEVIQEDPSEDSLQMVEGEIERLTDDMGKQEEVPALMVEKQEEVPDVMDVVEQDGIPALSDAQEKKEEVPSSQGVELLKQEVARRSHVLGSLSKFDENSARQLLNDSGWNVSQSTRQNGKTQWYYRSPPPKPVLLGSLTSAVAMWKRLVDEDHKRKGGADEDLYPMVTAFLSNAKRPTTAKKRKRGRHSD